MVVLIISMICPVRENKVGSQVLKQIFRQLVLFEFQYFLISKLLLILVTIEINKNFKAKRVVLVLSDCETIICEQEPVCSTPITVKQLVTFAIAGSMP